MEARNNRDSDGLPLWWVVNVLSIDYGEAVHAVLFRNPHKIEPRAACIRHIETAAASCIRLR